MNLKSLVVGVFLDRTEEAKACRVDLEAQYLPLGGGGILNDHLGVVPLRKQWDENRRRGKRGDAL